MRILITSDLHGDKKTLEKLLLKEHNYDYHLDAGDWLLSVDVLKKNNIIAVKGNNDIFLDLPDELILDIEEDKILLIHGHFQNVKYGMHELVKVAVKNDVDICIFGHTHKRKLELIEGILFINPGSLGDKEKSYAIYEDGNVSFYEII